MANYRQNASYGFIAKKPWVPGKVEIIEDEGTTVGQNKYSLPYGLCAKFGISLPDGARPRDAWEALKQHGVYPPWTSEGEGQYDSESGSFKGGAADVSKNGEKEPDKPKDLKDFCRRYNAPEWAKKEDKQKEVSEAIDDVYSKYDMKKLDDVNVKPMRPGVAGSGNGSTLNISDSFLKDPEGVAKKAREKFEDVKVKLEFVIVTETSDFKRQEAQKAFDAIKNYSRNNVIYSGDALKSIVAHELGHAYSDQYFGMINGDFAIEKQGKIEPREARRKIRAAFKKCKENGEIYSVSRYASENADEFFAECFAMKVMGKEELPPTVKKLFEEIL